MSPGPEVFLISNTVYPGVLAIEMIVIKIANSAKKISIVKSGVKMGEGR